MSSFVLRRVAASLALLFVLLTLLFFLLHLAPGEPAALFEDPRLTEESRDNLRRVFGIDRPLPEQYLVWMRSVLVHWDWGTSFAGSRPVSAMIGEAFPNTARLALAAFLVNLMVGVPLGIWAALKRGQLSDSLIRLGSILVYSMPAFWIGLVSILFFAGFLAIFPAGGMQSTHADQLAWGARWLDRLHHLVLPATILGLLTSTATIRLLRNSLIEVMASDYIRTARAAGLSETRIVLVHGLRNALVPLLQFFGLLLPGLLNGTLLIEVVFSWPGLGRLMFTSIQGADFPVILALTALTGALVVGGNLAADLLQAMADPRVRHAS